MFSTLHLFLHVLFFIVIIVSKPYVALFFWSLWDTWSFAKASFSFELAVKWNRNQWRLCSKHGLLSVLQLFFVFFFACVSLFCLQQTTHYTILKKCATTVIADCSINLQYKSSSMSQSWHLKHKHVSVWLSDLDHLTRLAFHDYDQWAAPNILMATFRRLNFPSLPKTIQETLECLFKCVFCTPSFFLFFFAVCKTNATLGLLCDNAC